MSAPGSFVRRDRQRRSRVASVDLDAFVAAHRHECDREERISRRGGGLLALERVAHGLGRGGPLHVEQHRLGQEARLRGLRLEPRLHHVAGDVAHEQQARQHEERDDEQTRHESDEDIRQDELAAHAPEQPPPHPAETAHQQIPEADDDPEGAAGVDHVDPRGARRAERGAGGEIDDLEDEAGQQDAAGSRTTQPLTGSPLRRDRESRQNRSRSAVGHQRGARPLECAAQPIATRNDIRVT